MTQALDAIDRRCPADTPNAVGPAIRGMNDFVRQSGGIEVAASETTDLLTAYQALMSKNPQIDEALLARAAVDGMRGGVEPGAPPEGAYAERQNCDCAAGIGVELNTIDTVIVRAIPGSPAERAGIQPGDRIATIDGASTDGWSTSRVIRALRGAEDSTVSLTISRAGATAPIALSMRRIIIVIRTVTWRREGDIGVITITQFREDAGDQVRRAIRELRGGPNPPIGYILDLRRNSGGLLDQSIEVADLFLDGGGVVSVVGAYECPPGETATYNARRGDETRGAPLLVLTDSQTASGAELVAAALLDRHRAETVGQRTFGNGEIATMIPISRRALIRLRTGEMISPGGRRISEGLTPVHATPEATPDQDATLQRAMDILHGGSLSE